MSGRRDAVVIGSGAGGSVMAFELARRGLDVTVVEAGARWDPTTFEHDELAMFVRAYKHSGLQGTEDHDSLIVQGFTVGGFWPALFGAIAYSVISWLCSAIVLGEKK